jgi:DNA-binding NarL/FixJ family response regulator
MKSTHAYSAGSTLTSDAGSDAPPKVKILLVDDHPITRQGIKALVNQQRHLEICGEADNAEAAVELVDQLRPNLAIIDISLKAMNGIDLTQRIRSRTPQVLVLVVSMHDESLYAERALRAGATGYLAKQEASDKISIAIQQVLKGEIYLGDKLKEKMLHSLVSKKGDQMVFPIDTLSQREREVFGLIGNGFSTRQIAVQLGLSSKTIDSYREHLKIKLNLNSGGELVRHAIIWARDAGSGVPTPSAA